MNVKRLKRVCGVKGCKNKVDVFAIGKKRELSNTVIICKECLADALDTLNSLDEPVKVEQNTSDVEPMQTEEAPAEEQILTDIQEETAETEEQEPITETKPVVKATTSKPKSSKSKKK